MKKYFLLVCLAFATTAGFAQVKIGLKIAPNLAWNRADAMNTLNAEPDGARVHLSGGLLLDYFFGDNYAFSTGLNLATKGGTVKLNYASAGSAIAYDLTTQYLEVPVSVKLLTNDVAPNTKAYFQVGGTAGVLTGAKINDEKNFEDPNDNSKTIKATKSFNTLEVSALLGAGVEYQLGESTKLFTGLFYQHGITNIEDKDFAGINNLGKNLTIKNSLIGLDLGLKF